MNISLEKIRIHSRSIHKPFCQISVGVNPAVAQERPVRARVIHLGKVNWHNQNLFLVRRGFGKDFAGSSGDKTLSPKFNAVATNAVEDFMADAIGHGNKAAVGDGVRALDSLPGVMLPFAEFFLFAGMPADGGRVKKDFRALQRRQPRGFWIPLVPANQHADLCRIWSATL